MDLVSTCKSMKMFKKIQKKQKQTEEERLHEAHMNRYTKIARKILKIMFADIDNMVIGDRSNEFDRYYNEMGDKMMELMIEEKVPTDQVGFVFSLALQPVDYTNQAIAETLKRWYARSVDIKFGKKAADVTVEDIFQTVKEDMHTSRVDEKKK